MQGGKGMNKIPILLSIIVVSVFFSSCSDLAETNKGEAPIVITTSKEYDENYGKYEPGDDINENPMIQLGIDKLNIKIDYKILGNSYEDYINKIRLALSGADELPDVIPVYDRGLLSEMIDSGQVKEISTELLTKMPERLKQIYQNYAETFLPVERAGKVYGLAISPALAETQVLFIRQDWLERLDVKAPTNLEEFEQVIAAFSTQDPDGNGKNDTYGFSYSGNGIYSTGWLGDPAMIFSSMSGKFIPGNWELDAEGKLTYGSLNLGNKKALEKMQEWHQKGWIIPDAALTNDWGAMEQFQEGKVGMVIGRPEYLLDAQKVMEDDPTAKVKAYPTIVQANGETTYQRAEVNDGWFLFNKDFDAMDTFFNYYDWLYDIAFGTGDFQYGYLENYDYDQVEGQIVFDKEQFEPAKEGQVFDPTKAIFTKNMPKIDSMQPYINITEGLAPKTAIEYKAQIAIEKQPELIEAYQIADATKESLSENKFKGAQTPTMKKKWYKLQLLEKQIYTDIIYGKESISSFDTFVEKWYAEGGQEITEEVNDWYASIQTDNLEGREE